MKNRQFSIKNKILIVLSALPIFSIGLVVVMATSLFQNDKLAYVYSTALSGARAKSSSASSQINSFIQSLKALTVNYDLRSQKMSANGNRYFESEPQVKGFFDFKWTGEEFRLNYQKIKDIELTDEETIHLGSLLQEAWYGDIAIGISKEHPFHIYIAYKLGDRGNVATLLIENTNFFSLYDQSEQSQNFLIHKDRGVIIGKNSHEKLVPYLKEQAFNKDLPEETKDAEFSGTEYLASYSKVGIGSLYSVSLVDKKAALTAVRTLMRRSILFTVSLLSLLIIVGVFAANKLTFALRKLADATSTVMEGDFSVRVEPQTNDEIGSLAESFNKMTEEVSRLMEKTAENARMEAELETARTVQETLFPPGKAILGPVSIYGMSEPASECGGDWWHYCHVGDKVFVWIGDATGHGVPAALLTSAVRAVASVIEKAKHITPSSAMEILNRAIFATSKGQMMMTFFLGCFDLKKNTFTYSNASHDPPFQLSKDVEGKPKRKDYFPLMEVNNPRLGEKPDTEYKEYTMEIESGDKFIFYTDGILDVKNDTDEAWGERRFLKSLSIINDTESKDTVVGVFENMHSFRGDVPLDDDITLILVKYDQDAAEKEVAA